MKYYRLIETDVEEETSQSHIFIKVPETENERKHFRLLEKIVSSVEDIDRYEEFADDFGDFDDDECHSCFNFATDEKNKLIEFDQSTIDIILKENLYSNNQYIIIKLSEDILNYEESDSTELLSALEDRVFFNIQNNK